MNSKHNDLANIEFKKDGNSMKEDEAKVLVEGKTVLNCLSKYHDLDIYEAKKLKVIVGRFCGNFILYKYKERRENNTSAIFRWSMCGDALNKILTNYIFLGLKDVFKQVRFGEPGAYMANKRGKTIKYPINERMLDTFVDQLQQLFIFKVSLFVMFYT